jgi:Ca2+-binding RTX toxin-like protein
MAKYHYRGPDLNLFAAQAGGSLKGRFLYRQADQFGLTNPDGSKTYYFGTGLTWNGATGHFTGGTITAIYHYSADGTYIDGLTGLATPVDAVEALLTAVATDAAARALESTLLAGDDTLLGDNGDNVLNGAAGNDSITGGNGNDQLTGDTGNDQLQGGNGNDELTGGAGADILLGGDGRDLASYRASPEDIHIDLTAGTASGGHATGDRLTGIENIEGTTFADTITGNASDNWLIGLAGADSLHGEAGNDRLDGGAGEDFLTGSEGDDLILGGSGDDAIDAGSGRDLVVGGAGNDVIYGGPDPDVIIYDFSWEQLSVRYAGSDYSIWVEAPDGKDHVYSALTFATTSGTYRYDVPTESWVYVSAMTGDGWLAQW